MQRLLDKTGYAAEKRVGDVGDEKGDRISLPRAQAAREEIWPVSEFLCDMKNTAAGVGADAFGRRTARQHAAHRAYARVRFPCDVHQRRRRGHLNRSSRGILTEWIKRW